MANLNSKFHRLLETPTTEALLRAVFRDENNFTVHDTLPQAAFFGNEGAANHNRLGGDYGDPDVQLLVYGREEGNASQPKRYPTRRSCEASEAIARLSQVNPHQRILAQQNPNVIDLGVSHSDVIAISNHQVLFCHQQVFVGQQALLEQLRSQVAGFIPLEVPTAEVSMQDAVTTYLLNSQLLSRSDSSMMLILPQECREHADVWWYSNRLLEEDNSIDDLQVFDLRGDMSNGGGPACLRLGVMFTPQEQQAMNPVVIMNDMLFNMLNNWVDRYYRDRLTTTNLVDPQPLREGREALDTLMQLLNLGSAHPLQQEGMHHG